MAQYLGHFNEEHRVNELGKENEYLYKQLNIDIYSHGRPMTYFLYKGLTEEKLTGFLLSKQASTACIEDAIWKLRHLHPEHRRFYVEKYYNDYGRSSPSTNSQIPRTLDRQLNKSNNALFDYTILTPKKAVHLGV